MPGDKFFVQNPASSNQEDELPELTEEFIAQERAKAEADRAAIEIDPEKLDAAVELFMSELKTELEFRELREAIISQNEEVVNFIRAKAQKIKERGLTPEREKLWGDLVEKLNLQKYYIGDYGRPKSIDDIGFQIDLLKAVFKATGIKKLEDYQSNESH